MANGLVEAACNPLVAVLYPENKTVKLNQFHVWFPGGIVLGGLAAFLLDETGLGDWRAKLSLVLIPALAYGVLLLGQRFPKTENVRSGVSMGEMFRAALTTPFMLLMLACMALTASVELGPTRWVPAVLEAGGMPGILVLVYISALMAVLRYFAGPVVRRLSPTGVLAASAVLSGLGLLWMSAGGNAGTAVAAATVFAVGVCYFWPTMLGVVSERAPRSGALGLGLMGAVGMAVVGLATAPLMGRIADRRTHELLPAASTVAVLQEAKGVLEAWSDDSPGSKGEDARAALASVVSVLSVAKEDGARVPVGTAGALRSVVESASPSPVADRARELLGPAEFAGGLLSFRYLAPACAFLALVFGMLYAHDRRAGRADPANAAEAARAGQAVNPFLGRKLRYGMVGGGPGAFIGAVHRMAAALDGEWELVAGAFSASAKRSREQGRALGLDPARVYDGFAEMAETEAALDPGRRIEAVSVVVPNHLHCRVAKTFLDAGFHVVCDKPMAASLKEAEDLGRQVEQSGRVFALTHNYTGFPMAKEARHVVRSGRLGGVRKVVAEYQQGWLATPLERAGHKQAAWRLDPSLAGPSSAVSDIGSHVHNLVRYVAGLEIDALFAELASLVPERALEDDAGILVRFEGGAQGAFLISQVAAGEENGLRLRVYGEAGGTGLAPGAPGRTSPDAAGRPAANAEGEAIRICPSRRAGPRDCLPAIRRGSSRPSPTCTATRAARSARRSRARTPAPWTAIFPIMRTALQACVSRKRFCGRSRRKSGLPWRGPVRMRPTNEPARHALHRPVGRPSAGDADGPRPPGGATADWNSPAGATTSTWRRRWPIPAIAPPAATCSPATASKSGPSARIWPDKPSATGSTIGTKPSCPPAYGATAIRKASARAPPARSRTPPEPRPASACAWSTASPAAPFGRCSIPFPPVSPETIDRGYEDFAARWTRILDVFQGEGVRFALEAHPTEVAFDVASAQRTVEALDGHPAFGFNYDPSHLAYQGVDYIYFLERFADRILHVHVKDVWWSDRPAQAGVFGGHVPFGDPRRYWDFRSPGRGKVDFEAVVRTLNRIGYDGPLSVEWEDASMDREHGAAEAREFVARLDFPPSASAFDAAFRR